MTAAVDVSVVMGVYNGATAIQATLDSLLEQEDVALEVIVVDDGSTDGTGELLDRRTAGGRLRVIHQENRGLTEALRRGCLEARGRYVARQDAGDISHPRRLLRQKQLLDAESEVVFVSSWTRYVGPAGEELWIDRGHDLPDAPVSLIDLSKEWGVIGGPSHHGSVMMRREAYEAAGGYRSEFYFGQDWDLWYRLAERGWFHLIGETLYTARIAPESISTRWREEQTQLSHLSLAALRARQHGDDERPILEAARAIRPAGSRPKGNRADGLYFIGEALRRRGDRAARGYLRDAVAARPWMLRAWFRWLQSLAITRPERG